LHEGADPGIKWYMNAVSPKRNYAIDWLRVFAMFTVFLFHCARFFERILSIVNFIVRINFAIYPT
jgi:peptidoglycan/LPS O-acetylase OafA/YrhL